VQIENAGIRSAREIIIVSKMTPFFIALLALVASTFRTRAAQQAEIVALRHQIAVLQQSAPRRLRLRQSDRLVWIVLSRFWPGWRHWLRILKPDTVVRWHRRAFARYWTRKSHGRPGRPVLAAAIRDLIQQMSQAKRLVGTLRRECLDRTLFWTTADLEAKLREFQEYFNEHQTHAGLAGRLPDSNGPASPIRLASYGWQKHCRGMYQTPIAAWFYEFATHTTGCTEPDDGDDRIQKESENVAHARMVSPNKLKNSGCSRNSPTTRL